MTSKAIGYVRVRLIPPNPVAEERSMAAQTRSISAECERRGWILDEVSVDRGVGADDQERPGLAAALSVLPNGDHVGMVVTGADRLARRLDDWLAIRARAAKDGWELVATP